MSPAIQAPSATVAYTALHRAFHTAGKAWGIRPIGMRMLVAIFEGNHTTLELEHALRINGSQVRRAIPELRTMNLVQAGAADGSPEPKRGIRTRLTLTPRGAKVARDLIQAILVPQPTYATSTR